MQFSNRLNPKYVRQIGAVCLVLGIAWPRFLPLATNLGPMWTDRLRGLFFGVSIGCNILYLRLGGRQRRCANA